MSEELKPSCPHCKYTGADTSDCPIVNADPSYRPVPEAAPGGLSEAVKLCRDFVAVTQWLALAAAARQEGREGKFFDKLVPLYDSYDSLSKAATPAPNREAEEAKQAVIVWLNTLPLEFMEGVFVSAGSHHFASELAELRVRLNRLAQAEMKGEGA